MVMKTALITAFLLSLGFLQAQQMQEQPKHPGEVVKFEVRFDGPDADKIKTVNINFGLNGSPSPPANQAGFNQGFNGSSSSPIAPRTFHVEAKIPDDITTGDYLLNQIGATAAIGSSLYHPPAQFPTFIVHVVNPKTFDPPKINVTALP